MCQTPRQIKRGRDTNIPQSSGPPKKVGDEIVHKELGDIMERAATTASSLEAEQDSDFCDKHNMVAHLQKSEGSEEQFWQNAFASTLENEDMEITAIIDGKVKVVSEASIRRHLKLEDSDGISTLHTTEIFEQLALMGQEIKVSQPNSLTQTHVVDEAASTGVDDRHGGAATTVSGLEAGQGSGNIHKTPTMPHDLPLLRVHTLGSDEGIMQPNELMELVTKLSDRVAILENDLKQTKKTYGYAFTKLIKKVKTLEKTIKSSKARRRAQFVVSDDEEEDSFNQGRKIAKIDEDPDISLVQQMIHHDAQTQERQEYDLEPNFEFTAPEEVHTADPNISTANVPVSTAGAEVSTAAKSLVYIRRSAAKRKDKGKAIVEESEPTQTKTNIQKEQERLGTFKPEEWDNMQAQIKADEELAHRLQTQEREGYSKADKAKLFGVIHEQLRGYSFNEIKVLFEAIVKRVNTFTPMESDDTVPKVVVGSLKEVQKKNLNFDRDDLVKLWDLVRERFSSTEPTDDKERALWFELKRLFEPDADNLLEL
ncbi:hypothetical protein Tco_0058882 [Tanacetum coccineum]